MIWMSEEVLASIAGPLMCLSLALFNEPKNFVVPDGGLTELDRDPPVPVLLQRIADSGEPLSASCIDSDAFEIWAEQRELSEFLVV